MAFLGLGWGSWLGIAAAALAAVLGAVVLAIGGSARTRTTLAILLFSESVFQAAFTLSDLATTEARQEALVGLGFIATFALAATYPWILRELDTPLVRPLRPRRALVAYSATVLACGGIFGALLFSRTLRGESVPEESPVMLLAMPAFLLVLALSALAFFASISAFRRAAPGAARERARAFAIAFGARDVLFLVAIALNFASSLFGANDSVELAVSGMLSNVATLVYVPLLAYGILKTQLFDIDLRIKKGIERSTVVTIVAGTSIVVGKLVDHYAQAAWGWIAGIAVALAMLLFTRALERVGHKVANTALPQVQATPAYVQFKKLEVYKAAVETALEGDGRIDEKERRILDKLREKLGIGADDASALETEATAAAAPQR